MLRRAAVALFVLGVLAAMAPATVAEAAMCPKGKHWVKTAVTSSGAKISGLYRKSQGYCKTNKSTVKDSDRGLADGSPAPSDSRRFCLLQGVTKEERDGSFLTINGDRWLLCPTTPTGAVTPSLDVAAVARSLVVRLQLPPAKPIFGPDPNNNEWKMLAVGFPVWLTTAGPRHRATTASAAGLTFRLSADLVSTRFSMGDGSTLTCSSMTTYSSSVKAGSSSPTCGHTYTKPSLPKGSYTVTATPNWMINWSVDGISGRFPMSYSDSAQLPIGELQALNR